MIMIYIYIYEHQQWMFPTMNGRSDHPCRANSMWRRYTFTKIDRMGPLDSTYWPFTIRYLDDDANATTNFTIFEAEDAVIFGNYGDVQSKERGFTGTGYRRIFSNRGPSLTIPALEWTIGIATSGTFPLSFRYALGDTNYAFPGNENHPYDIVVNGHTLGFVDFLFTDGWRRWHYTPTVQVALTAGNNTVQIFLREKPSSVSYITPS